MGYVATGFIGVLLGAAVTLVDVLLLLQKRADRDLIERRIQALLDYREWLGEPDRLLNGNGNGDGDGDGDERDPTPSPSKQLAFSRVGGERGGSV